MAATKQSSWLAENVKTLLVAVVIAVVVRSFAYEPFNIPSESMVPNLLVGDYLFVSKLSYGYGPYSTPFAVPALKDRVLFTQPERGDVVVFRLPSEPRISYIKRLVGLPGDTIQLIDGVLHINDEPVDKTPRQDPITDIPADTFSPDSQQYTETLPNGVSYTVLEADGAQGMMDNTIEYIVPDDHYFVMGDNRDRSADSRDPSVGMIPKANLLGRASVVVLSMGCNAKLWEVWKCPGKFRTDRFWQKIS